MQFSDSYYMALYMAEGSWDDAEQQCTAHDMHLWSINSYTEWWNLYPSFSFTFITTTFQKDFDSISHKLQSTVLLFIGLRLSLEVNYVEKHNKKI